MSRAITCTPLDPCQSIATALAHFLVVFRMNDVENGLSCQLRRIVGAQEPAKGRVSECDPVVDVHVQRIG